MCIYRILKIENTNTLVKLKPGNLSVFFIDFQTKVEYVILPPAAFSPDNHKPRRG